MLKIYNQLTRTKELFEPLEAGKVGMYVCGMTVYDYCHVGHARVFIVFDMIVRYLEHIGYEVNYVRNITDIDDKIIQRAIENNESIHSLCDRFITAMHEDQQALGIRSPNIEPKATEHLPQIIEMISILLDKGYAYNADHGDVYFAVDSYPNYGALSGKKLDELQAGARVEVQSAKRNPLDFVLWKKAKPNEPSWNSPFGAGRPGWHIECSAMANHYLGKHFDIHGGGQDLQFPHHENEIAQSCCAMDAPFVKVWIHNGFVRVDDEKMSKSLGNFFTVREVCKQYSPEVLRFFILSSHYRSPLNYSEENLKIAYNSLTSLYIALREVDISQEPPMTKYVQQFNIAMDDDFHTPEAMSVLHSIAHAINRSEHIDEKQSLANTLHHLAGLLGLLTQSPEQFLRTRPISKNDGYIEDTKIEEMIEQRNQARHLKDFAQADQLREKLLSLGIIIEDTANGTLWRR